jgi:hypothetical protein
MENSSPPQPLLLSTAGRMLGENELLDALQRGIRQAFAFLDGGWGTIPPLWWYRFTEIVWYRQRVTFVVDGRAIEATETVVDRPPPICEQRKNLVEKLEQERLTKAIKAALGAATDTAEAASSKDPAAIALRERQKGGDDTAAAAAVLFNHPNITNAELALAVPARRTSTANSRSRGERGRLLRRSIEDRYPNFPAGYSGP